MQNFYDTVTNQQYSFNDDVAISGKQGAWIFTAAHGAILGPFPDTLTPGTAPYIPPPTPTLAQQAAAMIAAGLGITSTGTPALNGTYSVDATAQHNIQAVQIYIQANGKFPGSSGTYAWLDKAGAPHAFPTVAEFTAFATAVADFVADLQMIIYTGTGTLPAATVTIP